MSNIPRPTVSMQGTIPAASKHHKKRKHHRRKPCGNGPILPTNVILTFDTVDRGRHDRIRAISKCDEISKDIANHDTRIDHYVFKLESSSDGITADIHPRKASIKAKDAADSDTTVEKVWHAGIRKHRFYRTSVKAVDINGCTSGFSAPTSWASPNDNVTPPIPTSPILQVGEHHLHCTWNSPVEPGDVVIPDESIAFFHLQIATDAAFTNIIRTAHTVYEHKNFKISKPSGTYWMRVQSVDSSRNKSAFAIISGVPVVPNVPAITSITFDVNGTRHARYRGLVTVSNGAVDADANISRLLVQFCHKPTNTTPTASDRKHHEVLDPDDDLIATFRNIRKNHFTFARVRKWDTQGRKSVYSGWTPGGKPSVATFPTVPVNVEITNPSNRKLKVKWDMPPGDDEEVDYFIVEIRQAGDIKETAKLYGDHYVYHIPKADRNLVHHAKVFSVSDLGDPSATGVDSDDILNSETIDQEDIEPDNVRYDRFRVSGAKAFGSTNQSVANNTEETMGLNSRGYDTDLAVDFANDCITIMWSDINSKGVYMFVAHAQFEANATGRRLLKLQRKDGSGSWNDIPGAQFNTDAAGTGPTDCIVTHPMGVILDVVSTKIRARVLQNSGGGLNVNGGSGTKFLSITYLGTADALETVVDPPPPPGPLVGGKFTHTMWGAAIESRGTGDATQYGGTAGNDASRQSYLETQYGRRYEVVRVYSSDWTGSASLNTTRNRQIVTSGSFLWPSMRADESGTNPSWVNVGNGTLNANIQNHADQMKAVYNTTFTNNADQILIFTFHHEPQGDNTGIAANYVSAYRNYRTVFLARMASDTGGAHFLGTILFGPIHYGVAYKDGSVATNGGAPGAWWPDNPIYGAGGTCDFAAADPYNWWPAQGTSLASEYSELSADKRAGHLAAFALANGIQAFLGELGTFEREPSSFVPGNPRGAGNRWDPTTTAPKASGVNAGGGPPFDRWPPDALTMARDITGSGGIQSKPAWIDHARLWIAAQLDGGGLPVVGVCCWFDEVGNFNRFTNSSQNSIDAMVQMATDPAFNA